MQHARATKKWRDRQDKSYIEEHDNTDPPIIPTPSVELSGSSIQSISNLVEASVAPKFDSINATNNVILTKQDTVISDTKAIIEKMDNSNEGYTNVAEKIDYVSQTLVDQANKEKERADRAEQICHKVAGQLGQQGFKRRKADEANWAYLREENTALFSMVLDLTNKVTMRKCALFTFANFDHR